jgi:hypothetical protein
MKEYSSYNMYYEVEKSAKGLILSTAFAFIPKLYFVYYEEFLYKFVDNALF